MGELTKLPNVGRGFGEKPQLQSDIYGRAV